MKATILVPAYDDERTIGRVLAGLALLAPSPEHEVIVVDDGSTSSARSEDGTPPPFSGRARTPISRSP